MFLFLKYTCIFFFVRFIFLICRVYTKTAPIQWKSKQSKVSLYCHVYLTWDHIDPQLVWSRCPKNIIERYTKMGFKIDKIFPDDIVYNWHNLLMTINCLWNCMFLMKILQFFTNCFINKRSTPICKFSGSILIAWYM